jgi:hypothetical protein
MPNAFSPAIGLPDSSMIPLQQLPPEFTYIPFTTWYNPYVFQDEQFFYIDQQEEMESVFPEYEEHFVLTQPTHRIIPIDPNLVDGDIIDEANSFCNVCGVPYQVSEGIIGVDDMNQVEDYVSHVNGTVHRVKTISYKKFRLLVDEYAEGSSEFTTVQLAEKKLKECKSLKADTETDQLDQSIDSLEDKIQEYNKAAAEFEDTRKWREGVERISSINTTLSHLLSAASDQCRKLTRISTQRSTGIDEEDEFEIDALSANIEKDLDQRVRRDGKSNSRMRTADEKRQSRDRKRSRKQN